MNKTFYLSALTALLVTVSGCQAESNPSPQEKPAMTAAITELQKIDTQVGKP